MRGEGEGGRRRKRMRERREGHWSVFMYIVTSALIHLYLVDDIQHVHVCTDMICYSLMSLLNIAAFFTTMNC